MANRQRAEARRKAAAKAAREEGGSKPMMWVIAGVIVVIAIVVAVVATGGGTDATSAGSTSVPATTPGSGSTDSFLDADGHPYSQPVTIEGAPLAPYNKDASFDDAVEIGRAHV